jgi:hypothetical protein
MPTPSFSKAVRHTAGAHRGVVAAHAAINNMPTFSVIELLNFDGTTFGTLWSKGDVSSGKILFYTGLDNRITLRVARAGAPDFYQPYDDAQVTGSWHWLMTGYDFATGIRTVYTAPKGGAAVLRGTWAGGGSGALSDDSGFDFVVGGHGSTNSARNIDRAFTGVVDGVPTLSQFQAIIDDVLEASWEGFWKPEPGMTTSIPNGVIADPVLPPMVLTGATIVNGPDPLAPAVFDGIEVVSNPNTEPITTFPHLLDPIVLRPIDQYGAPWTGTVPADGVIPANHCSAAAIGLPYVLGGTTVVALSGGVWTFSSLMALEAAGPETLAAPTLTAGAVSLSGSTATVPFTAVSSGAAYPSGTTVQLRTRRGSASYANQGAAFASASSRTLSFTRESTDYDVDVVGIASASGATSSAAGAVVTITVPALTIITPGVSAMPLRATVKLYPSTGEPVSASGTGAIPSLAARTNSDCVLRVTDITLEPDLGGGPLVPDAVRFTIADASGVLLEETQTVPHAADDWRIVLPRALFAPNRDTLLLDLTFVAEDSSETFLQFLLPQGVRQ